MSSYLTTVQWGHLGHAQVLICSPYSACRLFLIGFWFIALRGFVLEYLIISGIKGKGKMPEKKAQISNQQRIHLKINLIWCHLCLQPSRCIHWTMTKKIKMEVLKSLEQEGINQHLIHYKGKHYQKNTHPPLLPLKLPEVKIKFTILSGTSLQHNDPAESHKKY